MTVEGASMPAIYPFMGYRDAQAAIEWLCRAFGFQQHAVYDGPDGRVAHAELKLGPDAIVMLGSIQHDTLGLRVPGGIYAAVEDLDTPLPARAGRRRPDRARAHRPRLRAPLLRP
jgi:uncharacterized glyoxalase superfamily protein PhnB